jgi:prepilin-type N-terminal cleavage/methylation domain-containing protein
MKPSQKKAFTLVEILVVLVIMGFLVVLVLPKFAGTLDFIGAKLNKSQMQEIKRATLEFYNDVGFVPDNVTLLTYPWENCKDDVNTTNFDSDISDVCINMIAFIDKHYKFEVNNPDARLNNGLVGDNGLGTQREQILINAIRDKLDPDTGWKGGYIGGNEVIKHKNIKRLGTVSNESDNLYYFTQKDIDIYYENFPSASTLHVVDTTWNFNTSAQRLYPIFASDFNGTRHSSGSSTHILMDELYENAKYSKTVARETTFLGAMTVLDPYGTPYEIQIPTASAVGSNNVRTRFARIVSFGKNRRRDTQIDLLDIDYSQTGYDDSVLYIFDNNQTSYFFPKDEEQ